ncbi:hypothetical protein EOM82_08310, partial [bacterium]|nr:hypothetical protein [bacterium]
MRTLKRNACNALKSKYPFIKEVTDDIVICGCYDKNCSLYNTCQKTFSIKRYMFNKRSYNGIDICPIRNNFHVKSFEEKSFTNFINSIYDGQITENDRKELDGNIEIDVYLPQLKIGFEYNGDYWHRNPIIYPKNDKIWKRDMTKPYIANKKGISLYTVWEHDWEREDTNGYVQDRIRNIIYNRIREYSAYYKLKEFIDSLGEKYVEDDFIFSFKNVVITFNDARYNSDRLLDRIDDKRIIYVYDYEVNDERKFEIIKSDIRYALGKIRRRIYARKCELKEITNKEASPFLMENSLFGHRNATLTYGLYFENELVMVYSFGNNYYGKKGDIEVIRVCTKKDTQVIGGSSKCLKRFLETHKDDKRNIVFYVDKIHHDGKSLRNEGFEFVRHEYGVMNYWLIDYYDENFDGKTGTAFNRRPSKNK